MGDFLLVILVIQQAIINKGGVVQMERMLTKKGVLNFKVLFAVLLCFILAFVPIASFATELDHSNDVKPSGGNNPRYRWVVDTNTYVGKAYDPAVQYLDTRATKDGEKVAISESISWENNYYGELKVSRGDIELKLGFDIKDKGTSTAYKLSTSLTKGQRVRGYVRKTYDKYKVVQKKQESYDSGVWTDTGSTAVVYVEKFTGFDPYFIYD